MLITKKRVDLIAEAKKALKRVDMMRESKWYRRMHEHNAWYDQLGRIGKFFNCRYESVEDFQKYQREREISFVAYECDYALDLSRIAVQAMFTTAYFSDNEEVTLTHDDYQHFVNIHANCIEYGV